MAQENQLQLLTVKQVRERLGGISNTTFYNRQKKSHPTYDPNFPKKVQLKGSSVSYFSSIDVDNYIIGLSHSRQEAAA